VKTNEDTLVLLMFAKDSSFWSYKVYSPRFLLEEVSVNSGVVEWGQFSVPLVAMSDKTIARS